MKLLHIDRVEVVGPHALEVRFDDGVQKRVDVRPLLEGPIFEPLLARAFFARVVVDPRCGTVVWPNGADLAPEALYALPPLEGDDAKEAG